jgi:type 1 fimbria pilin
MYQDPFGNSVEPSTVGMAPIVSLSAVSAVGAGSVLDGLAVRTNAVMSTTLSSTATGGAIQLEASLDGVNFWAVGSAVTPTSAGTSATTQTNVFARYFRAHVTTAIAGTGSPTVTVSVGVSG